MNICIDARPLQNAHRTRGVGVLLQNLLREMGRSFGEDEVSLLTLRGKECPPLFPAQRCLETRRLERPNRFNWIADQLQLPGLVRSSGAGLFLATDFNSYLVPRPGVRVVAMAYDLIPFLFPEVMASQPLPVRLGWRVNFAKLRSADAIIAISEATKNDLVRLFGIDPQRITVVHPGIDHRLFNAAGAGDPERRREVLARHGVGGRFLLYVGDSEWRKNLRRVLEALAGIDPTVKLVLIGKRAPHDPTLSRWLDETGMRERVVMTGYVPDADLPLFYGAARAFVFPTLYEGFGFPVVEAMACGCPVITSAVSSLPEVAGGASLLVDPGNVAQIREAIVTVLGDEERSRGMIAAGLARAVGFRWEESARRTLEVLRRVGEGGI